MAGKHQVFYYNALALGIGQDIPQALGGAAGANLIQKATGKNRIVGLLQGSVAAAANYPRIRFWASPSAATALATYVIPADPANLTAYPIDTALLTPFFSIEWLDAGAGGTVSGVVWAY